MQAKALKIFFSIMAIVTINTTFAWAGTATLSWDPNTEADLAGYKVHYGNASSTYTQVIDVGLTTTPSTPQYIINNLTEGNTYFFAVTAYDASGNESGYSNEVSKTITDTTPPVLSAIVAGNISSTGATITWTTDEPATSQVEYGPNTSYGSSSTLNSTLTTSHSVTLSGLAPGTTYHYKVKSTDAAGIEAISGDNTFSTAPPPTTTTTTIVTTTTTNPSTTTTKPPTSTTSTTVVTTTTTKPSTTTTKPSTTTTTVSTTTTTKPPTTTTTLPPPTDTTPPMTVSEFQTEVGDGQVHLSWLNPPDLDHQGVRVRYRTDGKFPANPQDGNLIGDFTGPPLSKISHTHSALSNGTTYYYAAFAYDTSGNYSQSVHLQATPQTPDSTSSPQTADNGNSSHGFGCGRIKDISGGSGPTAGQAALNLAFFTLLFMLIKMRWRLMWRQVG